MNYEPPDADVELCPPDPASEVPSWAFLSHTTADTPFLQREVVQDRTGNFFLMDYRTHSGIVADAYRRQILQVLSRCAWFVVAVSEASIRSAWCGSRSGGRCFTAGRSECSFWR